MKVNDKVDVLIAGQVVAQATVKELGDGTATLVVPATLVVMATRTELTVEAPREQAVETVITGVDRAEASTEQPVQSAAVGSPETNEAGANEPSTNESQNQNVETVEVAQPVQVDSTPANEGGTASTGSESADSNSASA